MNHNRQLLQSLYSHASGKYLKFKQRLDKAVQSGRFYKLNKRKQSSLVSRLRKLFERLKSLQAQLRVAGAGAALALTISITNPLNAQNTAGPFVRNDATNPFAPPVHIEKPHPTVVDIDNDGDLDVFIGKFDGSIQFFRNDSPAGTVTRFTEVTGSANPLNGVFKGNHAAPSFGDVDGDGDFDMIMGVNNPIYDDPAVYGTFNNSSKTFFFENTGTQTNAIFTERTGTSNPFNGIYGTKYGPSMPTFVYMDGDSDIDLFVGGSYAQDYLGRPLRGGQFFQNQGSRTSPDFISYYIGLNYYLSFGHANVTFADIDNDGDLDAFAGSLNNHIRCFRQGIENTFSPVYNTQNPFNNFTFGNYTSPVAADFDKDGDLDFIVASDGDNYFFGPDNSNIRYVENTGNFSLTEKIGLNLSPFDGVDVGREAVPVFVDLDGDNDLDVLIGSKYSEPDLFVYTNTNGKYKADPDHPLVDILNDLGFSSNLIPVFADIDNDGDKDLFISRNYEILFFRKTGANFVNEPTLFPTVNSSNANEISLAFLDLDKDGDLDAFVGNYRSGQPDVVYFKNNGTPNVPNFAAATPPVPFNTPTLFEKEVNLSAVDLDNDGDTDLVVTQTYYNGWYGDSDASEVLFFENKNDGTFVEAAAPIIKELTPRSFTSFVDIDGDGDLDAFVGNGYSFDFEENGRVFFFENTNPPPTTTLKTSVVNINGGDATVIDPELTITDSDDDDIVLATVTISDFVAGDEELDFNNAIADDNGIDGVFDSDTGILSFNGKASIAVYQDLLRTVTIDFTGTVPGGRRSKASRAFDLAQDVTFQVRDTDFTLTTVSVVSLNFLSDPASEITIYNAFSPNGGDNINQFFNIRNIETVSPDNKVTIYNRWGDAVFEITNYNNTTRKFVGQSDNGKELPTGTYFYKIEATNKTHTGYLSLKR